MLKSKYYLIRIIYTIAVHNCFQSNVTVDVGGHTTIVSDRGVDENQESSVAAEANKSSMKGSASLFLLPNRTGARPKRSTSAQVMV